jgi:uncharacterized membrane protein YphA (DoxX/SURF4 family)
MMFGKGGAAMRMRRKTTAQTVFALLLCLALATAFVLCGITCAKHALHCCGGGDCRICDLLLKADRSLKQLSLALLSVAAATISGGLLLLYGHRFCANARCGLTLVRLRIRFNC